MADARALGDALAALGVRRGGTLLAHSSLSGSGLRAADVRDALLGALGPDGTLVVPAFTPENSTTSTAHLERVAGLTEREAAAFRAAMPPFDPATTPCPSMGVLAERVRTTPGAVRSGHPQTSFAALGPRAAELMDGHHPHCHLGERSPLARLYEADAQVLLLRVGFAACSAFHLAEYRGDPPPPRRAYHCVVGTAGNWVTYEDLALDDGDFAEIGAALPPERLATAELAGRPVTLVGLRDAVDHARDAMTGIRR
ncbi:AAC(3) family N-acetyltransferase [Streptomyces sp. NPDC048664]|uniref:aminoglycoside N(3)-acetyltransferase n=1 Tax=Streptomyces sp. NPDC048664 TaxID=3154505 RepID=UPI003439F344